MHRLEHCLGSVRRDPLYEKTFFNSKAPFKIGADDIVLLLLFSRKMLHIYCESTAKLADDSHEISRFIASEKNRMSSAAVVICSLRMFNA